MKTLRFLLVMTFALASFVGSAGALGGGTQTGYLSLPVRGDPSIPIWSQAQRAFEWVLPALQEAQAGGSILDYEPIFSAGVVKIKYAAGTHLPVLGGMPVHQDLQSAAPLLPHATPFAAELRTAYDPHFEITAYGCTVNAYGLESGDLLIGSLYDAARNRLAVIAVTANINGDAWGCFDGAFGNIFPGNQVVFKVYSSGGVLRGTYQATVPKISIDSMNKTASTASGTGPAGKPFLAIFYHENLDAGKTYSIFYKAGTLTGAGTWSVDFGTTPYRGGDTVLIYVQTGTRFSFERWLSVPYSYCHLLKDFCGLYGFPRKPASMTITHAGTSTTKTGIFSTQYGLFRQEFETAAGLPILLVPGDKFQGTNIAAYKLPNLTANINYAEDVVTGRVSPNKYFDIAIMDSSWTMYYDAWIRADAAGNYIFDLSALTDLTEHNAYMVQIRYTNPITGNSTYLTSSFGP